ncbi:hypothetical protein [Marinobacter sp.]|uniref:hypothetical protein n=1 Tax=Marinobacter sp. TaxID=50741 RepID=UPI002B45ED1E|nr:hypothetical protein [Marinobacter sp.]HKK54666.1 hypothetical protein [Marinobacter sp.]
MDCPMLSEFDFEPFAKGQHWYTCHVPGSHACSCSTAGGWHPLIGITPGTA